MFMASKVRRGRDQSNRNANLDRISTPPPIKLELLKTGWSGKKPNCFRFQLVPFFQLCSLSNSERGVFLEEKIKCKFVELIDTFFSQGASTKLGRVFLLHWNCWRRRRQQQQRRGRPRLRKRILFLRPNRFFGLKMKALKSVQRLSFFARHFSVEASFSHTWAEARIPFLQPINNVQHRKGEREGKEENLLPSSSSHCGLTMNTQRQRHRWSNSEKMEN